MAETILSESSTLEQGATAGAPTLKQWWAANPPATCTWNGTITAWKSGSKSRHAGRGDDTCPYLLRHDFASAWMQGWAAMDAYLQAGGTIAEAEG